MTLFTLLIVMALERVTTKTKELHITTWMAWYVAKLENLQLFSATSSMIINILVAISLSFFVWLLEAFLPGILVFCLHLLLVWACLGCPVTRKTYKQYLQAASREDFEACYLHSTSFGIKDGDLSKVGKQLIFINYRQYASVIIFYVFLGLPGLIFYCAIREINGLRLRQKVNYQDRKETVSEEPLAESEIPPPSSSTTTEASYSSLHASEKILFVLDWLPTRLTALGYLLVGHFGKGLPIWLETVIDTKISTYDLLTKVAIACEDVSSYDNPYLEEPIQLVRLVKRNIVFLLMAISLLTLVGVVT